MKSLLSGARAAVTTAAVTTAAVTTVALILPAPAALAADSFAACLSTLRAPALKAGVLGATFDTHTAPLVPDMAVIDLLDAQRTIVIARGTDGAKNLTAIPLP